MNSYGIYIIRYAIFLYLVVFREHSRNLVKHGLEMHALIIANTMTFSQVAARVVNKENPRNHWYI